MMLKCHILDAFEEKNWQFKKQLANGKIHIYVQLPAFKEELIRRNPGSVVDLKTEIAPDEKVYFHRIFITLDAGLKGFLHGCRPYLGIDACHLKGKYKGVLAAATGIDRNKCMFAVSFAVMEPKNTDS